MGFQLGRAYDMAEQPDSAIANYERYVNAQSFWAIFPHAYQLAPAYERLGALYEQQGDVRKAIYYYGKLVELWENADPELQPRVDAARRAMAALSGDR
jgi:tetratricopeptide (TPR) repeat protein